MSRISQTILLFLIFISCNEQEVIILPEENETEEYISAVDISSYPEIEITNPNFYDLDGQPNNFLDILKANGINTIRLRLWVDPINGHSGFEEVKEFSNRLKSLGFNTWLALHYSDTWADPSRQEIPTSWQGLTFSELRDSVFTYTQKVVTELQPNYIQIGNEINSGLLHPFGEISTGLQNFQELIASGISAVRSSDNETKIILHFAGIDDSDWFFDQVRLLDYDIIGLSYYPIWHGKSLEELKNKMQSLSETYNKKILIAETAYPFTLQWNDWTNNIVGLEEQLILPEFPATEEGQRNFISQLRTVTQQVENGIGLCYWGAELVAWKGNNSPEASPWENQALFDFTNRALPALREFRSK